MTISPTPSPPGARRASLQAVLAFAWRSAEFTASEALHDVGLTRSTTIEALDELALRGLLRELPNARAGGDYRMGRPARRFELRADAGVVIGVDAGRAHLTTIIADLRGVTLARAHVDLDVGHDSDDERRAALADAVDAALEDAGATRGSVLALCVGVPAPVDARGTSPVHPNGFWRRMNPALGGMFAEWAPIVRVENDASLAAVAEGSVGAAVGIHDYIALLAGERLGAGVVVDGSLLRGAHGGVAEMVAFDHVNGVEGAWGLGYRAAQWAREAVRAGEIAAGHPLAAVGLEEIDGRMVLELAAAGDEDATAIAERVGGMLARVVAIFGSLFDPRRVVVCGGIAEGVGGVIDVARKELAQSLDLPSPEIVASALGADVVATGAVSAALQAALDGVLALRPASRVAAPSMADHSSPATS